MAKHSESCRMDHVISIRADDALLADVRKFAAEDEVSVSDWMRRATANAVFEREKPVAVPGWRVIGWQCPHMTMTAAGVTLGKLTAQCGCDMQPVYEQVAVAA